MTLSITKIYHYAECRHAECQYAECRGGFQSWGYKTFKITMPGDIVNLQKVNQNIK
jgi:hypothetical protein